MSLSREQSIEPDLQEQAIKQPAEVQRFEQSLRAKVAQKGSDLEPSVLEERIQRAVDDYAVSA